MTLSTSGVWNSNEGATPVLTRSQFLNVPKYDDIKWDELRTWIMQLLHKLWAEEKIFADERSLLYYTLNPLEENVLQQVIYKVNKETGHIDIETLNTHLDTLRQAYNHLDKVRTAVHKLRQLRQRNQSFVTYFAKFGRLIGGLAWDEEVHKNQIYEVFSEKLKETLVFKDPSHSFLDQFITLWNNIDTQIRAHAEEKKSLFPFTTHIPATTPTARNTQT